jgi:hypothetical protein
MMEERSAAPIWWIWSDVFAGINEYIDAAICDRLDRFYWVRRRTCLLRLVGYETSAIL